MFTFVHITYCKLSQKISFTSTYSHGDLHQFVVDNDCCNESYTWNLVQIIKRLPTARVMTPSWSRISWTTWLFCSGVDLQQMTALHPQLSSRKSPLSSSCRAHSSVLPSMTSTKSEEASRRFPAALTSVCSFSSFSKAAHASWWNRNLSVLNKTLLFHCMYVVK